MATIDNLEIHITADAGAAIQALDRLASSAGRLRGAATKAGGGMRDLAAGAKDAGTATQQAGQQAGNAEKHTRNYGRAAEEAGKAAKRGTAGIATFWQALKRVAYYRFIRTIIKAITSAFKEGITNAYNYSKAIGGTFAQSMDRLASSTLYLKNSLGAMLTPLINTLAPVLEWIIDRIVDVINWINMLFAALSGSQTYMVAKKVAKSWGDAGSSVSSSASEASDAAKELQRTILGFDEINKLEKENKNSGGGGGGGGSSGTSTMFEERQLEGWLAGLAKFIDDTKTALPLIFAPIIAAFETIKGLVGVAVEKIKEFLNDLAEAGKTTIQIAVSLVRKGWETLKGWVLSFGEAAVSVAVSIATTAQSLWEGFKKSWNSIAERIVKFTISAAQTAKNLWEAFKKDWDAISARIVQFTVSAAQTAKNLWEAFKTDWNAISARIVQFTVSAAQTAKNLWEAFKKDWNAISARIVQFTVSAAQTAKNLWEAFKKDWDAISARIVGIEAAIVTTAASLWKSVQDAWFNLGEKVLDVQLKITTGLEDLWNWLKENWEKVALGALGIAVAIITPWETLATALSGLWANVMASFGGSLAFGVTPSLGVLPTPSEVKGFMKPIQELLSEDDYKLYINAQINGETGEGPGPLWNALTGNGKTDVEVDAYGNMMFVPKSGNGITVDENEELSLTKPIGAKLQAKNTPTDAFGGGENNPLSFFGRLFRKDNTKDSANKVFNGGDTLKYYGALFKKAKKYAPGIVFANNSLFKYFAELVKQNKGMDASVMFAAGAIFSYFADLVQNWKGTPQKALGLENLKAQIKVDLVKGSKDTVSFEIHGGGTGKGTVSMQTKKRGGIFSNGSWKDIPQYANGTTNAHGSMFIAGEAGPELVGHLGGRTEVLNQSQLAATMFSAVRAAMGGVKIAATMYSGSAGGDESDYETMYRAMYDAFTDAMSGSEQRDREKVALMREIAAKEFTAEVSAQSVNRANTRLNRRAGMTIVPVGT